MVVIFLDIDGVLVTARSQWAFGRGGGILKEFDRVAVGLLNNLIKINPDTKLVISSTWRLGSTIEELQTLVTEQGIEGTVVGKTPRFTDEDRGVEIKHWLDNHPSLGITNYLILDDDYDMLPEQTPHFSPIDDSGVGLDMDSYLRGCVILGHEKVPGGERIKSELGFIPKTKRRTMLEALQKICLMDGEAAKIASEALQKI